MSKMAAMAGVLGLVTATAAPVAAQDVPEVAGQWEVTREAPTGARGARGGGARGGGGRRGGMGGPSTLVLEQDGATVTGVMRTGQGETALENVTLEGHTLTFTITRNTPRGEMRVTYTANVDGNEMSGTMEVGGGRLSINWNAKRETD